MKTNLLKAIAFAIVMTPLYNCSVEPEELLLQEENMTFELANVLLAEPDVCTCLDPKVQIINNGTVLFNLEVYTADLILQNSVYNLQPGSTSEWLTISTGNTLFSLSNVGFPDEKVVFDMSTCSELTLEIASDNSLLPSQPIQL